MHTPIFYLTVHGDRDVDRAYDDDDDHAAINPTIPTPTGRAVYDEGKAQNQYSYPEKPDTEEMEGVVIQIGLWAKPVATVLQYLVVWAITRYDCLQQFASSLANLLYLYTRFRKTMQQ